MAMHWFGCRHGLLLLEEACRLEVQKGKSKAAVKDLAVRTSWFAFRPVFILFILPCQVLMMDEAEQVALELMARNDSGTAVPALADADADGPEPKEPEEEEHEDDEVADVD